MADEDQPVSTQVLADANEAAEALLTIPGRSKSIVFALVDPTSFVTFKVFEDVIQYYGIDNTKIGGDKKQYSPKKRTTDSDTYTRRYYSGITDEDGVEKTVKRRSSNGQAPGSSNRFLAGKIIRLVTKKSTPKKNRRIVSIRVPGVMSMDAVSNWIYNCFTDTTDKPKTFISPGGRIINVTDIELPEFRNDE